MSECSNNTYKKIYFMRIACDFNRNIKSFLLLDIKRIG